VRVCERVEIRTGDQKLADTEGVGQLIFTGEIEAKTIEDFARRKRILEHWVRKQGWELWTIGD